MLPHQAAFFYSGDDVMESLTLKISGLQDEQCVRTLANAIQDLPHIGYLDISLESGEVVLEHGRFVSPGDILQAIEDAGFEAQCVG
jgi:copper chaperone